MAEILNTIPIDGMIAPSGTTDEYATHSDSYGLGGLRIVSSLSERNAISSKRRKAGMIVGVDDNGVFTYYKLKKTTWNYTSNDWEKWTIGGNATNKQIAFGDINNEISSSSNLIYDYTTQTLKVKGKDQSNTNIFEVLDSNDRIIVSIDTDYITKIYDLSTGKSVGFKTSSNLESDIIYTLPTTIGTSGSTLINDGTGTLSWGALSINGNKGYIEVINADGNTKTWNITHGLENINVMVQVFNNSTSKNIEIEVLRTGVNTIQVNSPINLPVGNYTVLVASMMFYGASTPSVGGVDGSIQFNKSSVLDGEEYFKYIYSLSDSSKKVQLTTSWGTDNTIGNFEVCVNSLNGGYKNILGSLGRRNTYSSDMEPVEIREGILTINSTYPNSIVKASLYGGGEGSGILELYNPNYQTAKISEDSFIIGTLMLGANESVDEANLAIKSTYIALNVYDKESGIANLTISKEGNLVTKGFVRVGDISGENAEESPGNIRYDSSKEQFLGYKGGSNPGWVVLG